MTATMMMATAKEDIATVKEEIEASVDLDATGVQQLAVRLSELLKVDEQALLDGNDPSLLALYMPRKRGRIDKINRLAHEVAVALFPPNNDAEKLWSLIRYTQLLTKLTIPVKARLKKEEDARISAKRSAAHLDDNAYCMMKSRPVSDLISNPTPMPVNLTDISELQPFFSFLESNANPLQPNADEGNAKVEYPRGIFYSDGRMDLCKQVVGPGCIEALMDSLKGNTHVKHFLLGNNLIGPVGAHAISNFLADERPDISTWYLAGNCIDSEGMKLIAAALAHDTAVESLWLKRNPIGPAGAYHLSRMLMTNTSVQTLDLSNCGLLDEGIEALVTGLKCNHILQHLYLGANGITSVGATHLGAYFKHCADEDVPGLVSLYLSVNRIGDDGAANLAQGLKYNTRLKRLVLASNQIQAPGVQSLCDALTGHPALEVLGLGMYTSTTDLGELPNRIQDKGAEILAELIRTNPHLALLDVTNNRLTVQGWTALATAALESPGFLHLDAEKFLVKTDQLHQAFINHLEVNIKRQYGIPRNEFLEKHLKYARHPESVRYIVSLYRTRDFRKPRQARKDMKKLWDADDVRTLELASHPLVS